MLNQIYLFIYAVVAWAWITSFSFCSSFNCSWLIQVKIKIEKITSSRYAL